MTKNKNKNKIKILGIVFGVMFLAIFGYINKTELLSLINKKIVYAGPADNVFGSAWSENLGWFNFNSIDSGVTPGPGVDYGVDIVPYTDPIDGKVYGKLVGYAWSENMGWFHLNPSGPYPLAPNYSARIDLGTGEIHGWSKILNLNDDGWVSHNYNDGVVNYNTYVDLDDNDGDGYVNFHGFAWNNILGWLQYGPVPGYEMADGGGVYTLLSRVQQAPYAPIIEKPKDGKETWSDYPEFRSDPLRPILTWSPFADPNLSDTQESYKIEISDTADFSNIIYDKEYISASNSHAIELPTPLTYNEPRKMYWWRVQVVDNTGLASDWSTANFITPLHAPPTALFSTLPESINEGVETQFNDESITGDPAYPLDSWIWTVYKSVNGVWELVNDMPMIDQNPKYTFEEGDYRICLEVSDSVSDAITPNGYSDTICKEGIEVRKQLPIFERKFPE